MAKLQRSIIVISYHSIKSAGHSESALTDCDLRLRRRLIGTRPGSRVSCSPVV